MKYMFMFNNTFFSASLRVSRLSNKSDTMHTFLNFHIQQSPQSPTHTQDLHDLIIYLFFPLISTDNQVYTIHSECISPWHNANKTRLFLTTLEYDGKSWCKFYLIWLLRTDLDNNRTIQIRERERERERIGVGWGVNPTLVGFRLKNNTSKTAAAVFRESKGPSAIGPLESASLNHCSIHTYTPYYFEYKTHIFHILSCWKIEGHLKFKELFISLQTLHRVAWKEPNVNTFWGSRQATSLEID
jgi:hypothetical protein